MEGPRTCFSELTRPCLTRRSSCRRRRTPSSLAAAAAPAAAAASAAAAAAAARAPTSARHARSTAACRSACARRAVALGSRGTPAALWLLRRTAKARRMYTLRTGETAQGALTQTQQVVAPARAAPVLGAVQEAAGASSSHGQLQVGVSEVKQTQDSEVASARTIQMHQQHD